MIKALLIAPIRFYKFFLSPWVGQSCRFTPTCSSYAIEAIETQGALRGTYLATKRLCRCHPWAAGGHDPVCQPPRPNQPSPRGHAD
jgi:putative membrane protein insertion efficiency factor